MVFWSISLALHPFIHQNVRRKRISVVDKADLSLFVDLPFQFVRYEYIEYVSQSKIANLPFTPVNYTVLKLVETIKIKP